MPHFYRRINIGDCFQAKIPNLLSRTEVTKDPDNTTLVWSSWNNLDVPGEQQKGILHFKDYRFTCVCMHRFLLLEIYVC